MSLAVAAATEKEQRERRCQHRQTLNEVYVLPRSEPKDQFRNAHLARSSLRPDADSEAGFTLIIDICELLPVSVTHDEGVEFGRPGRREAAGWHHGFLLAHLLAKYLGRHRISTNGATKKSPGSEVRGHQLDYTASSHL